MTMTLPRPLLPAERLGSRAEKAIASFHSDLVAEVINHVANEKIVIVGMRYNLAVIKARRVLSQAGVPFVYLEYGSYFSQWRRRLAIKLWSGWPTFPQIFVEGRLIGGCSDLIAELKNGKLKLPNSAPFS